MLAPGDRIGDWVVDHALGEGGMGAVYRAHNVLVPDIIAAVKVLKPHALDEARERFFREVQAVHRLRHPNIVRITGFGEDRERRLLWMAMDLIEGRELGALYADGPLACSEAVRLFDGLIDALAHAHGLGVFHRDLKPGNVLVDASGQARLVDFGIAAQEGLSRLTGTGMVVGTPAYMPPEVFDSGEVDPARADVYAIGQMLYELLTGGPAHPDDPSLSEGQRMGRVLAAKMQAEALDPGGVAPPDIRSLVRDATAPDPEQRIPTALALRERLRSLGPETRWVRIAPPPEATQGLGESHENTWGGTTLTGEKTWDGDGTDEAPRPSAASLDQTQEGPSPLRPRPADPPESTEPAPRRGGVAWIGLITGLVLLLITLVGLGVAGLGTAALVGTWAYSTPTQLGPPTDLEPVATKLEPEPAEDAVEDPVDAVEAPKPAPRPTTSAPATGSSDPASDPRRRTRDSDKATTPESMDLPGPTAADVKRAMFAIVEQQKVLDECLMLAHAKSDPKLTGTWRLQVSFAQDGAVTRASVVDGPKDPVMLQCLPALAREKVRARGLTAPVTVTRALAY